MRSIIQTCFLLCLFTSSMSTQNTLRFMHYNILNFGSGGSCPSQNTRVDYLNTIMAEVNPDIFTVNEMRINLSSGVNTRADKILDEVFNDGANNFSRAQDTYLSTGDQVNMVYYNHNKVELYDQDQITHDLNGDQLTRLIDVYRFFYTENMGPDTVFFDLIVAHLKASLSQPDILERARQTAAIMNYINTTSLSENLILAGDLNVYSSAETGFLNLINPPSGPKFNDPVNQLGPWHENLDFKDYHTQSTRLNDIGCGSSAGMNDRFDFILTSDAPQSGTNGLLSLNDSYTTLGQDGSYYDDDLQVGGNSVVNASVANALFYMSDHLPVSLDFFVDYLFTSTPEFKYENSIKLVNPAGDVLEVYNNLPFMMQFAIFSLDGKKVYSGLIQNVHEDFNIAELSGGAYLVKFYKDQQIITTKKFIK